MKKSPWQKMLVTAAAVVAIFLSTLSAAMADERGNGFVSVVFKNDSGDLIRDISVVHGGSRWISTAGKMSALEAGTKNEIFQIPISKIAGFVDTWNVSLTYKGKKYSKDVSCNIGNPSLMESLENTGNAYAVAVIRVYMYDPLMGKESLKVDIDVSRVSAGSLWNFLQCSEWLSSA